jgi:hypothetical protein
MEEKQSPFIILGYILWEKPCNQFPDISS